MSHIKVASTKFKQSDHGQIVQQTYKGKYQAACSEIKKMKDQGTAIKSLGGMTSKEIA
jgi:hypothetical protein